MRFYFRFQVIEIFGVCNFFLQSIKRKQFFTDQPANFFCDKLLIGRNDTLDL